MCLAFKPNIFLISMINATLQLDPVHEDLPKCKANAKVEARIHNSLTNHTKVKSALKGFTLTDGVICYCILCYNFVNSWL